jgi:FMN phosphatase YigB (HAD superfamily)
MTSPHYWLLDFDDTLASGPVTWGLVHAFPKLIRDHALPVDDGIFRQAILRAQERSNTEFDPRPILHDLFLDLGWPAALEEPLLNDVAQNYRPELFPDAAPFLDRLRVEGCAVLVVSNNSRSAQLVSQLGLQSVIDRVFTPRFCPGTLPKPHRSLWDHLCTQFDDLTPDNAVMVGDDPWSDGAFAENAGVPCWIVDRGNRYSALVATRPYRWAISLLHIDTK